MPSKDPKVRKATWNKWYQSHKSTHHKRSTTWTKQRRLELKAVINEYKLKHPCSRCGFTNPIALEFHHLDPHQKDLEISKAISKTWSDERLKNEIAKCVILCANCHRIEHAK